MCICDITEGKRQGEDSMDVMLLGNSDYVHEWDISTLTGATCVFLGVVQKFVVVNHCNNKIVITIFFMPL